VFTTVSEVTAIEAEKLLGRVPDEILPNGINIRRFAALHEFQNLHLKFKERIHEFVMGHFFPSYTFDLDRTLYFVTSGRYEYKNKGLDMFIEALARLNWRLKQIPDPPTVVAFIITRAPVRNINVGVLQKPDAARRPAPPHRGSRRPDRQSHLHGRRFRARADFQ
jgi:glycogen(starch) synthase